MKIKNKIRYKEIIAFNLRLEDHKNLYPKIRSEAIDYDDQLALILPENVEKLVKNSKYGLPPKDVMFAIKPILQEKQFNFGGVWVDNEGSPTMYYFDKIT